MIFFNITNVIVSDDKLDLYRKNSQGSTRSNTSTAAKSSRFTVTRVTIESIPPSAQLPERNTGKQQYINFA